MQGYHDLHDFWQVYQCGFDAREVMPDIFSRFRGLSLTPAIPIPDQALASADERIIDSQGFLLDGHNKKKITDLGLDPDGGIVMRGQDMPSDFAKRLREGLEQLGLKAVIVQSADGRGDNTGLFVDVTQPGYAEAMVNLHRHLPGADQQLINHTLPPRKFLAWLKQKQAENDIAPGTKLTFDNMPEEALKATRFTVIADVISGVEQELSTRSCITKRRFSDYLESAYGPVDGFWKLVQGEHIPNEQPYRTAYFQGCSE